MSTALVVVAAVVIVVASVVVGAIVEGAIVEGSTVEGSVEVLYIKYRKGSCIIHLKAWLSSFLDKAHALTYSFYHFKRDFEHIRRDSRLKATESRDGKGNQR